MRAIFLPRPCYTQVPQPMNGLVSATNVPGVVKSSLNGQPMAGVTLKFVSGSNAGKQVRRHLARVAAAAARNRALQPKTVRTCVCRLSQAAMGHTRSLSLKANA